MTTRKVGDSVFILPRITRKNRFARIKKQIFQSSDHCEFGGAFRGEAGRAN
jgi:hypothetical protein